MPKTGQRNYVQHVTPKNRAAKKKHLLELLAAGETITSACKIAEIGRRTVRDWRQADEKFAVAFDEAQQSKVDLYVQTFWEWINDPQFSAHDRVISLMFLTKQLDPSFRDNTKIEVAPSPGLAKSLAELAKAAEQDERLA